MPQLRLTLLVVGLIFLVALAWWELRRPHQVRGSDLPRPAPEPLERPVERTADWDLPAASLNRRTPELELPRMSARDPEEELPVVEVDAEEFAAFEARAAGAEVAAPAQHTAELPAEDFAADFTAPEPQFIDTRFGADFADEIAAAPGPDVTAVAPATSGMDGLLEELGSSQGDDPPISDIEVEPHPAAAEPEPDYTVAMAAPVISELPPSMPLSLPEEPPPASVIVDWPAAEASQVLAIRVISAGEKFPGRAVRMALSAEGFVLGKFEIFHKPAADGRAVLSIASLTKPGTFDLNTIDMQRYSGLNLFAVLPGPVPGLAAVDELLACAQLLAQRLRGVLQDEQGGPLNPSRIAALHNLAAAAPT